MMNDKYTNYEVGVIELKRNRNLMKYMITPSHVKVLTNLQASVPDDSIYNIIVATQDTYIKSIIGCSLFNELLTELELVDWDSERLPDAISTINGVDYKSLYSMIIKPLAWQTAYSAIIPLTMPMSTTGIKLLNTDYSSNTDLSSLKYAAKQYEEIGANYSLMLKNYVINELLDTVELKKRYGFQQGDNGLPLIPYVAPKRGNSRKSRCNNNNCRY